MIINERRIHQVFEVGVLLKGAISMFDRPE